MFSAEPQKALRPTMKRNAAIAKTEDCDGSRGPATNRERAGQCATAKAQIDRRPPAAAAQRRRSKPSAKAAKATAAKAKVPTVPKAGPDFGGPGRFDDADAFGQKRFGAFPRRQQVTNRKVPPFFTGAVRSRFDDETDRSVPHLLTREYKDKQVKIIYGNRRKSDGPVSSEQKKIAKANSELMKRILNAKPSVSSYRKK